MKFKKSLVLFEEALKDLEVGCYNKAVSSSYFAVRLMAEVLLEDLKTTKDDKIANAVGRILGREVKEEIMWLFEERKKADHRPFFFDKERTSLIVERASKLLSVLKEEIERREREKSL